MRAHGQKHAFLWVVYTKSLLNFFESRFLSIFATPIKESRFYFPILACAFAFAVIRLIFVFESIWTWLIGDNGFSIEQVFLST